MRSFKNAVTADDVGVDIGQQWIGNPLLLAEFTEKLYVVVGDRVQLYARLDALRLYPEQSGKSHVILIYPRTEQFSRCLTYSSHTHMPIEKK
jgi:hypothetical protein